MAVCKIADTNYRIYYSRPQPSTYNMDLVTDKIPDVELEIKPSQLPQPPTHDIKFDHKSSPINIPTGSWEQVIIPVVTIPNVNIMDTGNESSEIISSVHIPYANIPNVNYGNLPTLNLTDITVTINIPPKDIPLLDIDRYKNLMKFVEIPDSSIDWVYESYRSLFISMLDNIVPIDKDGIISETEIDNIWDDSIDIVEQMGYKCESKKYRQSENEIGRQITKEKLRNNNKEIYSGYLRLKAEAEFKKKDLNIRKVNNEYEVKLPYFRESVEAIASSYSLMAGKYNAMVRHYIAMSDMMRGVIERNNKAIKAYAKQIEIAESIPKINRYKVQILKSAVALNESIVNAYASMMNLAMKLTRINEENISAYAIAVDGYLKGVRDIVEIARQKKMAVLPNKYKAEINILPALKKEFESEVSAGNLELKTELEKFKAEVNLLKEQQKILLDLINITKEKVMIQKSGLDVENEVAILAGENKILQLASEVQQLVTNLNATARMFTVDIEGSVKEAIASKEIADIVAKETVKRADIGFIRGEARFRQAKSAAKAQLCAELAEVVASA